MSEETSPIVVPMYVDAGAPTICFDGAPALWYNSGLYSIVLASGRPTVMSDKSVPVVPRVVCQLQSNRDGLLALKKAIDDLLLASAEPHGKAQ